MSAVKATTRLRELMNREDKILTVMHPPSVALARVMEAAGVEAGFIGTAGVVGSYTGQADVGVSTLTECIQVAGWIAQAVSFPVILDGDTGHGGIMAVRRMVRDCINAGVAGVRIDDQCIEHKRGTGNAGIAVESLDVVLARYSAAVDMKNELDPDFVIMAQSYAGEAEGATLESALERTQKYKATGVDWVQFTAPHTRDDIIKVRETIPGPLSVMQEQMDEPLSNEELLKLGITLAWEPQIAHQVTYIALHNFVTDYVARGQQAIQDFNEHHKDNPWVNSAVPSGVDGETVAKMQELEAKYFSS